MAKIDRQAMIARLRAFPKEMEKAVRGLSEEQLDTPYGPGKWTVRQVVNHVSDSHLNGFSRMKMVVTEKHPTLKPYDQDAWAALADTAGYPTEAAFKILHGLHERWAVFLESLEEEAWARTGYHPETGDMSVEDLLVDYAEHGDNHIGQIMGLRRARGW